MKTLQTKNWAVILGLLAVALIIGVAAAPGADAGHGYSGHGYYSHASCYTPVYPAPVYHAPVYYAPVYTPYYYSYPGCYGHSCGYGW